MFWERVGTRDRGECRRNAPRAQIAGFDLDVEIKAFWPMTEATDWCGQQMSLTQ
jgi:hypothetical protein